MLKITGGHPKKILVPRHPTPVNQRERWHLGGIFFFFFLSPGIPHGQPGLGTVATEPSGSFPLGVRVPFLECLFAGPRSVPST